MQKNRGLITPQEFYAEQQIILLSFSNSIQDNLRDKIREDIMENKLLKIESELM
jgi:hypothetical protein